MKLRKIKRGEYLTVDGIYRVLHDVAQAGVGVAGQTQRWNVYSNTDQEDLLIQWPTKRDCVEWLDELYRWGGQIND